MGADIMKGSAAILLAFCFIGCVKNHAEIRSAANSVDHAPHMTSRTVEDGTVYAIRFSHNDRYGLSIRALRKVISAVKIVEFGEDGTFTAVPQSCTQTSANEYKIVWDEHRGNMIGLGQSVIKVDKIDEGKHIAVTMGEASLVLSVTHNMERKASDKSLP